ncbi:unnamed protein product, partial [Polarella glacialis]
VAHHVAYWGRENWMSYAGYPFKHLKVGGRPPALSETAYAARATALILAGLCAVPWATSSTPGPLVNVSGWEGAARRPLGISVNASWSPPDLGLVDVQRDLCSHGVGLMEGTAHLEERLLARCFPAQRWTDAEAAHCGPLQPARLLVEYRRLMAGFVFAP